MSKKKHSKTNIRVSQIDLPKIIKNIYFVRLKNFLIMAAVPEVVRGKDYVRLPIYSSWYRRKLNPKRNKPNKKCQNLPAAVRTFISNHLKHYFHTQTVRQGKAVRGLTPYLKVILTANVFTVVLLIGMVFLPFLFYFFVEDS
ncbi:uncharacterized protein LOC111081849 [Drosophila obscura]|uniref:uncharacterized protein LOC111081849 n=1 Tax=Drosophila obscura TaxID=7282 RepID=UPI001BB14D4F|nr:uncharacterized protein LOC111081849 [Drosophila obscura]